MAEVSPQLKRKREGVEEQKKKQKKLRKDEAAKSQSEQAQIEKTSTPKSSAKATPKAIKMTVASDKTPIESPLSSKKKKKSQPQLANDSIAANVETTPVKAASQPQQSEPSAKRKGNKQLDMIVAKVEDTESKKSKLKKSESSATASWSVSEVHGGWFLPIDPIFSPDEKYLVLGTPRSLQVYDTETSTLANRLHMSGKAGLKTYALSTAEANQVYYADTEGILRCWNWSTGSTIGRWDLGGVIQSMTIITQPESGKELIYCYKEDGNSRVINVYALSKSKSESTEEKCILKSTSMANGFQILAKGRYIVVAYDHSFMVGSRNKPNKTALSDFSYTWRELHFSKYITTFTAHIRTQDSPVQGKKTIKDGKDTLDVAVGHKDGSILVFEDVLRSLIAMEAMQKSNGSKPINSSENLKPMMLHWHREAVDAAKWSLDGNYLISGGHETVLTIWQLATGKPQHLPHLTAAIERLVVSPSGTSYAITLANNSVVVVSTSELEAKTNIVGMQARRVNFKKLPKDASEEMSPLDVLNAVPMVVDPKVPSELLYTTPSSQPLFKRAGLRPEPYLQTYDIANDRATTRQALTRNNATDLNISPEGGEIAEPNVQFLQVSHDGAWLATVDEWTPTKKDTKFLDEGIEKFNEEERLYRREVYLKVWQRDEQKSEWRLEARIDGPHFFEDVCGNGKVFDLVSDPVATGFASIGDDHVVRIWRPKTRLRNGMVVRGVDRSAGLVTWSMDRSVEINNRIDLLDNAQQAMTPRNAKLAFSSDSSLLAAAVTWHVGSDSGAVHLIDTKTSAIRRSITEIDISNLSSLAILGQHLIVVSDNITVWDLVSDQLIYSIPVKSHGATASERTRLIRLAINEVDNTFAVAAPKLDKATDNKKERITKASSKISIYRPESKDVIYHYSAPTLALALTAQRGDKGYIVLDTAASMKIISPADSLRLPTPPPENPSTFEVEMEDDEETDSLAMKTISVDDIAYVEEQEPTYVNQQKLQEALDTGSVLPPPRDLFSAVLALVGKGAEVA